MTWAFLSHLLQHAEAKKDRTEEKYKKGVTFFGEKRSVFLGLRQKEPLFTPPMGTGCCVPLVRQNSCSFASDWAGPRGSAKEESSERQDWEAKIKWERDWQ